jgi:hypothetical protein
MSVGESELRKYPRPVHKGSVIPLSLSRLSERMRLLRHSMDRVGCGNTTTVAVIGTSPAFSLYAL